MTCSAPNWGGDSAVTSRFVYAADAPAPSFLIRGTNTYRILSDERGSVRLVVNVADGSVAQELDYDEFGRVLTDTNPGFQPFGYAGGLYDPDTSLVRFGLRDYSPETGSWTARDPILFDSAQFSLYAYAQNDPINLLDPLGTGPNHSSYASYSSRFSLHQRKLLEYADIKIERSRSEASILRQIDEHDINPLRRLGEHEFEAIEYVGKGAIGFAAETAELFHRLHVPSLGTAVTASHVVETVDMASKLGGQFVNDLTGQGLEKAQAAAQSAPIGRSVYATDVDHGFLGNLLIYGQTTAPPIGKR